MKLPAEILKKVKLLEIQTRKWMNSQFLGEYRSALKGQGMTFSEFREYVPGDDVRTISWAVTARTGKPFIKKFDEERELTVMLMVDVSGSTDFGSGTYLKGEVMVHLAALLGFSAIKNSDRVGLILFSEEVEHYVAPQKGRGHMHRLLRDLFYVKPKKRGTRMSEALNYLQGVLKKRSSIFIMSDFMDEGFEGLLKRLGQKHEIVAIVVQDPLEKEWPTWQGVVDFHDAETGEMVTVDTSSPHFKKAWQQEIRLKKEERDRLLRKAQVDRIDINTQGDYVTSLLNYFKNKHRH